MPSDKGDRQFERALQRHMRGSPSDAACPDAEALAAYQERTLSPEEMARWKEHIGGCVRCQETLALVEETDSIASHEWDGATKQIEDRVFGNAASAAMERLSQREEVFEEASMAGPVMAKSAPAQAKRVVGPSRWKWIAPVGALAAGLLIFVIVRESKVPTETSQPAIQVAENRETAPPTAKQVEVPQPSKREEQATGKSDGVVQTQKAVTPPGMTAQRAASNQPTSQTENSTAWSNEMDKVAKDEGALSKGKQAEIKPRPTEESRVQEQARVDLDAARARGELVAPVAAPAPTPVVLGGLAKSRKEVAQAPAQGVGMAAGVAPAAPGDKVLKTPLPSGGEDRAVVAAETAAKKSYTGLSTITGTVLDPSGAAIGGAVITAVDTTNGSSRKAVADSSGVFRLTDLPTDPYRVIVAHEGFAPSEQTLTLHPRHDEQLLVRLNVEAVSETVEVTGAATTLQTQSSEVRSLPVNGRNFSNLLRLATADPHYIVTPDQKIVWHVGDSGKIERTADGGKTWKPQVSGVLTELTGGSAPTEKVCWLAGKAGTLLRTTDGGKHWTLLDSPLKEDVGGLHAVDAKHARIWDVGKRKSFQTADGGLRWTSAANK